MNSPGAELLDAFAVVEASDGVVQAIVVDMTNVMSLVCFELSSQPLYGDLARRGGYCQW